jgi:alpha-D-ribose 1-methylphosphonate 5-triphosphate synthase subunit PhnL
LFDNPLIAFVILTLGAASVFARVVGIVNTLAMFAEPLVPSQVFASAEYNIAHGLFMRRQHIFFKTLQVFGAVTAKYIGQSHYRSAIT